MGANVQFVIITGISGSGKSLALRIFEDLGYFCVDNIPPALVPQLAELCRKDSAGEGKIACVIDVRSGGLLDGLGPALDALQARDVRPRILFLDADDSTLVNRFKETRRRHPLHGDAGGILGSLAAERERLRELKERADKVIDTSDYTPRSLAAALAEFFGADAASAGPIISILSFGFKHGLPLDADLVFDVRFLPNPHYQPALRPLPGASPQIRRFVLSKGETRAFLRHLYRMVDYLLPQFVKEGKTHLSVAIGCTGGKHRSVVLADELSAHLRRRGYKVRVRHRDVRRE